MQIIIPYFILNHDKLINTTIPSISVSSFPILHLNSLLWIPFSEFPSEEFDCLLSYLLLFAYLLFIFDRKIPSAILFIWSLLKVANVNLVQLFQYVWADLNFFITRSLFPTLLIPFFYPIPPFEFLFPSIFDHHSTLFILDMHSLNLSSLIILLHINLITHSFACLCFSIFSILL